MKGELRKYCIRKISRFSRNLVGPIEIYRFPIYLEPLKLYVGMNLHTRCKVKSRIFAGLDGARKSVKNTQQNCRNNGNKVFFIAVKVK